jgi:hypothetical protein
MSCYICGESRFGNRTQLHGHGNSNHALCSCTCNKNLMDEDSLDNHKKQMQKNAKSQQCSGCCRSFVNKADLYKHKRSIHHWMNDERENAQKKLIAYFVTIDAVKTLNQQVRLQITREIELQKRFSDSACCRCDMTFLDKMMHIILS